MRGVYRVQRGGRGVDAAEATEEKATIAEIRARGGAGEQEERVEGRRWVCLERLLQSVAETLNLHFAKN